MATTQNGGKNGKNEVQVNNGVLETMERTGDAPPAPRSGEAARDKRFLQVSDGSCVVTLEKAHGFGKAALHLEAAVSLALFAFSDGGADKTTKRHAMDLYGKAGYDVAATVGEDYKTINRRVNAFALLYAREGRQTWIDAMEGQREEQALEALKNFLTTEYNFRGINDVLKAAGKPVKQYAVAASAVQPTEDQDTSTLAGGEKGEALPQGTAGEGGVDETTGQPLTKEGEIDKRTKPVDGSDTAEGVKTRMENNPNPLDKLSDKMPEGEKTEEPAAPSFEYSTSKQVVTDAVSGDAVPTKGVEASPEDKATAARVAEQMDKRRATGAKFGNRKGDAANSIIFQTEHLHIAIPYDADPEEIQDMALQLMNFYAELTKEGDVAKKRRLASQPKVSNNKHTH